MESIQATFEDNKGAVVDTPVAKITELAEAHEAVLSGKYSQLFWAKTPVEPENWKFVLMTRSGDREVSLVSHRSDGRPLGYVDQDKRTLLEELAMVRLLDEHERLLRAADELELRIKGAQSAQRITRLLGLYQGVKLSLGIVRDLITTRRLKSSS